MTKMMKCAIYNAIQNVTVEERPIPEVKENDVLVKVLKAGICGSDVGIYYHGGENYGVFPGSQFGHEFVGVIVEKGTNVSEDIKIGEKVFVDPVMSQPYGVGGSTMAGAFSEYALVQNAALGVNLYPLGDDADLNKAVIIEPMSVGAQGALAYNPSKEDKIVVLGAGPVGLGAVAGLIGRGITNVVVVDRNAARLEKAALLGAKTINTTECELKEKLIEIFGAYPNYYPIPDVDMYVDAAGAPALLSEVFTYARNKTKYAIISVFQKVELPGMPFIAAQPMIYGSQGYTHETIVEVIDHVLNEKTPIASMVTHTFKHEDMSKAIEFAASGQGIKVVIDYEL
ncbi:MAG: alcohol dehydrogenase catalytic domain-containing protein [Erysipelotrichaceae bacterium]|nr:alcohol dehydrogenase catalytic domain-containing protein [Erysipelotrichaceae bacterium]